MRIGLLVSKRGEVICIQLIIKQVKIAIEDHHKNDIIPETLEGIVLYDADKLEITDAVMLLCVL